MNIENIRALKDAILTGDGHRKIGFNMERFAPVNWVEDKSDRSCKTSCCIGGWAAILAENKDPVQDYVRTTADYLDIDYSQASNICYGQVPGQYFTSTTAKQAVELLDILEETGRVDWNKVKSNEVPL